MNDHRDDEDALRRALRDAAAHLPALETNVEPAPRRSTGAPRWRRPLLTGLTVLVVISLVPIGVALLNQDHDRNHRDDKVVVDDTDGQEQVLQALAATVASGSYDLEFTFHIEPAAAPPVQAPCSPVELPGGSACGADAQPSATDLEGHGTVNTGPYAMTVFTSYLGGITLVVNDSTVWEFGGGGYGTNGASIDSGTAPGSSLSGFAGLVEATLGQGQGAMTMIGLASNTGYLGLESEMITGATPDGTGALDDGTRVTYYRVDVDLTKMASAPALSAEQRQTITDAIGVLQSIGYSGTDERIGVDDAGFIRDVVATTNFADGSSMTRHTVLSGFGCAQRVSMPGQPAVDAAAGSCPPVGTTTTSPTTSTFPTSTSAPTSTTSAASTSLPASTTTIPATPTTTLAASAN
jgi:hypothetical protein